MRCPHFCFQRVPWVDPDGNHRDNWIRCSHLVHQPCRQTCRATKRDISFKELPDGQIRSEMCPLDNEWV
ncbi:hypothetical protein [Methanospirillum sp.]